MWLKRIQKWVAVEFIMAFHANLERAVCCWSCDAKQDVSVGKLPIIQGDLPTLVDKAFGQFGSTCNAAAIFTAVWQINALLAQGVKKRAVSHNFVCRPTSIGERYDACFSHSQISLVQSPPG